MIAALVLAIVGWEVFGAATYYGNSKALGYGLDHLAQTLAQHPFGPWKGPWALIGGALGFVAVTGVWSSQQFFRGNFDPGKEHGDSRRATPKDFEPMRDLKTITNNMTFTKNAQLVINAKNKKMVKAMYAKNLNSFWVGTSGTGKSRNGTKPMIMNAVGSALADRVRWPGTWCEDDFDDGFDFVLTDPKGDTLRETGWMLHFAGFKVKVFNCIDFSEGLHFNPLWYIKCFDTDAVADIGESIGYKLNIAIDTVEEAPLEPKEKNDAEKHILGCEDYAMERSVTQDRSASGVAHTIRVSADVESERVSAQDYAQGRRSVYANVGAADADDDDTMDDVDFLRAMDQRDAGQTRYRKNADGSTTQLETVSDAALSIVYKRSEVNFHIELENNSPDHHDFRLEFELDDYLEDPVMESARTPVNPDEIADQQKTRVSMWKSSTVDEEGNRKRVVVMRVVFANRAAGPNGEIYSFDISCKVKQRRVADGVDLTCMIDALVTNLNIPQDGGEGKSDPFWDDTEKLLFMAIAAYLIEAFGREWCNFPNLIDYLLLAKVSFDGATASPLDCIFEAWETGQEWKEADAPTTVTDEFGRTKVVGAAGKFIPTEEGPHPSETSLAVHCYKAFKQGAPETLQSIIISCQRSLTRIATEELRELLRYDEMELETLGDAGQKQAIFGIVSDTSETYRFLFGILNFIVVNITCNKARERYGGKLPRHVHFIFDEFANIGKLPAFEAAISVVRSRNMSIAMFLQTISQMQKTYGKEGAQTIQGNCTTFVFLGGNEQENLKQISDTAGNETVDEYTWSRSYGGNKSSSTNRQKVQRPVVTEAQLRMTPPSHAWVVMLGMYSFCDEKYPLEDHPYYAFIDPGGRHEDCLAPGPFTWGEYKQVLSGEKTVELRDTPALVGHNRAAVPVG